MTHHSLIKKIALTLSMGLLLLSTISCTKPVEAGNVPHKPVPSELQGTFTSVHTRAGQVDQWGHHTDGLSWGTVFKLNADGTGTYVFRYDIVYYTGGTKSVRIEGDIACEITRLDANHVDMVIHFIRAKNYEDGKFLHDLDSSKIYPNGDLVYKGVEVGKNSQGKTYFVASVNDTFTKN